MTNINDQDDFEELLKRIRHQHHPHYGSINWDGKQRSFEVSVQFIRNGVEEPADTVRKRAVKYLESLTDEERRAATIDIRLRKGVPVGAILKGGTGELNPARLRALEKKVFE